MTDCIDCKSIGATCSFHVKRDLEVAEAGFANIRDNVVGAALERAWIPEEGEDWLAALNYLVKRGDAHREQLSKAREEWRNLKAELDAKRDEARTAYLQGALDAFNGNKP